MGRVVNISKDGRGKGKISEEEDWVGAEKKEKRTREALMAKSTESESWGKAKEAFHLLGGYKPISRRVR